MAAEPRNPVPRAAGPASTPEAAPAQVPPGKARRLGAWIALGGFALFALLQGAGVLVRDHLEGRRPALAEAPQAPPAEAVPARAPAQGRFGPGVTEVEVAGPEAPAIAVAPAAETSSPAAAEPPTRPVVAEPSAPPSPPPTTAPPPPPPDTVTAGGTHVLQVGLYRSQRYRQEAEAQLAALGLPHFRVPGTKTGAGYRVTVAADGDTAPRALDLLSAEGYVARRPPRGVEVDFHLEEEARAALALLTKNGFTGGYARFQGPIPLWTVYAGPFPEAEARATQKLLAGQGIPTHLRRKP